MNEGIKESLELSPFIDCSCEHSMTDAAEPNAGPRLDKPLTLTAMSLGFGEVQLDVNIVNTALDSIGASLGGGISELQWVVSIYTIAFAALILTAGALGDRFGAKKIFMAGFAEFTIASLACALAPRGSSSTGIKAHQALGWASSQAKTRCLASQGRTALHRTSLKATRPTITRPWLTVSKWNSQRPQNRSVIRRGTPFGTDRRPTETTIAPQAASRGGL